MGSKGVEVVFRGLRGLMGARVFVGGLRGRRLSLGGRGRVGGEGKKLMKCLKLTGVATNKKFNDHYC